MYYLTSPYKVTVKGDGFVKEFGRVGVTLNSRFLFPRRQQIKISVKASAALRFSWLLSVSPGECWVNTGK